ncbi:unnamed protein product [Nezara viridula]|uniref:Lysosomal Pro-X carboxypeptidase n=1 Tax=Nezara viridula TaxID=85310 RepID=A0A9P0MSX2_NEZVI|nr:unnamed protein product [Nezara viridula]
MYSYLFFILYLLKFVSADTNEIVFQTKYFDAPLDHFNFRVTDTFKLRYLINDTYWRPHDGAPIFFYAGNEGDIHMFANNTGFVWETAPEFQALIVFAEHRYYGESLPFGNLSFTDPKYSGYLSSQQALADFVSLIKYLKDSYKVPFNRNPVIAFGGSYGGMLAAWMRMKYPSVIQGALASSAPIWQFTGMVPCDAFNRVTSSAYKTESVECFDSIKKSWGYFDQLGSSDDGLKWLTDTFKLCSPLKDVKELKNWLNGIYVNLAMTNYPYPTEFLTTLPANPVKAVCKHLLNSNVKHEELLNNIFSATSFYFNGTGSEKCLDFDESTDFDLGTQGWEFQSCTEMVMPMCDSGTDMFEKSDWNIKEVSDECFKKFKVRPDPGLAELEYGGKDIHWATNIIFSNGLLDPWSSGGVLKNLSSSAVAVVIPESAHHLDLRFTNEADPESVHSARKFYKNTFVAWIKEHNEQRTH